MWEPGDTPRANTQFDQILLAMPAYNEQRYIGSVVIEARLAGFAVLVIDDGSTDRTAELAYAAHACVERHEANRGKAEALNTAFDYARSAGAEVLVVADADGQHDLREIQPLVDTILSGDVDIVIGSRFMAHASTAIPHLRKLGQRAMTAFTNAGSGVAVSDSQSGFRAFSRRAIELIRFRSEGFSVEAEMQFLAREHGLRVLEVPISAIYADPPKRNVFHHGTGVLNGVLNLIERHRPLMFFGVPGVVLMAMGVLSAGIVSAIYRSTGQLAIGYSLICVLLLLAGLMSFSIGILLHSIRASFLELERRLALLTNTEGLGRELHSDQC